MGYVIPLRFRSLETTQNARQDALIERFAVQRRQTGDVFWLKENAEFLNILQSFGRKVPHKALTPLTQFYESLERRLGFFPQYYRFILSIALDLEDLGLLGDKAERAIDWAVGENLIASELSDLQRAEARRLCQRRGRGPLCDDTSLDDRLRAFGSRRETFAIPNQKAACELCHIVFYLSQYGRIKPELPPEFIDSLHFAGTLAFLELNIDLLSEVCIALHFAAGTVPDIWQNWLFAQKQGCQITVDDFDWASDDYHPYLMVNCFAGLVGKTAFANAIPEGSVCFHVPKFERVPLHEMSQCLYKMGGARAADWPAMRRVLDGVLSVQAREIVRAAESAVDFEVFFAEFSRSHLQGPKI
ncbi:MAG: hypothetical protein AAF066_01315 [Pseudomonadota bacterium]